MKNTGYKFIHQPPRRPAAKPETNSNANGISDPPPVAPCRVLMANGEWKVPESQRPAVKRSSSA
jgi:hypothetical protein